jgi:hypothetical protein
MALRGRAFLELDAAPFVHEFMRRHGRQHPSPEHPHRGTARTRCASRAACNSAVLQARRSGMIAVMPRLQRLRVNPFSRCRAGVPSRARRGVNFVNFRAAALGRAILIFPVLQPPTCETVRHARFGFRHMPHDHPRILRSGGSGRTPVFTQSNVQALLVSANIGNIQAAVPLRRQGPRPGLEL